MRVPTPKREFDELLTKHTMLMSAYWITLWWRPRNCTEGPKSTELGFKWVLHIRNHYDLFCLVSLSYMEQTVSILLRLSVALFFFFFVILSCMTSSLCLFKLQSRLLFYRRFIADTRTKWQYLKGAEEKKKQSVYLCTPTYFFNCCL